MCVLLTEWSGAIERHAGKGGGRVMAAVGGLVASDGGGRRGSGGRGKEQQGW